MMKRKLILVNKGGTDQAINIKSVYSLLSAEKTVAENKVHIVGIVRPPQNLVEPPPGKNFFPPRSKRSRGSRITLILPPPGEI
ncbi:MAG: hypothetical protein QHH75_07160 [Bacillota bacterium]|nr:hypothetical protein [Bacillota bacterium]